MWKLSFHIAFFIDTKLGLVTAVIVVVVVVVASAVGIVANKFSMNYWL